MARPRIYIGIPHTGTMTIELGMNLLQWVNSGKYDIFIYPLGHRRPVDAARNEIVEHFLSKPEYEFLFMIDADMYGSEELLDMCKLDVDIVAALMFMWKNGEVIPLVLKQVEDGYKAFQEFRMNSMIEVDATGTGAMMIKRHVLEAMKPPYFKYTYTDAGLLELGQDYYFCAKARAAGHIINVHTGFVSHHYQRIDLKDVFSAKLAAQRKQPIDLDIDPDRDHIRRLK